LSRLKVFNERKYSISSGISEKPGEGGRDHAVFAGTRAENDRRNCAVGNNIVLELGVGTGAITKFLQDVVPNEKSYLGIELDRHLVRTLKKNYSDLKIVCGNATEMHTIHGKSGLGKVGCVICCLPFVSLPNEVGESILLEIDKFMQSGCTFRTFQYAHGYYFPSAIKLREFMRDRYGKAKRSSLIVKNVPPAYTLTWKT